MNKTYSSGKKSAKAYGKNAYEQFEIETGFDFRIAVSDHRNTKKGYCLSVFK